MKHWHKGMKDWQGNRIGFFDIYKINRTAILMYVLIGLIIYYLI